MRRRVATLATAAFMLALLVPAASASASSAVHVRLGQSIQAAIDSAPAGGLIYVARGTYPGSLDIARSVHLVGDHAVIVPAASDGFCLAEDAFPSGPVGVCVHEVSNVSIEGFTVRGFGGPGIVAYDVNGFRAEDVVSANNGMGMFINTATNVSLRDNRAHHNGGDGLFLEASFGNAVTGNTSDGNLGSGIMFIDSLGGRIANNDLHGNCSGILVLAEDFGFGKLSGDVSIQHNRVNANNRKCGADGSGPPYSGIGIALIGARNTTVARNDVRGNRAWAGSAIHGGGVVLLDGSMLGADAPTGNSIRSNRLSGNTPFDIYCDGSGTLNTVSGNSGTRSGC